MRYGKKKKEKKNTDKQEIKLFLFSDIIIICVNFIEESEKKGTMNKWI